MEIIDVETYKCSLCLLPVRGLTMHEECFYAVYTERLEECQCNLIVQNYNTIFSHRPSEPMEIVFDAFEHNPNGPDSIRVKITYNTRKQFYIGTVREQCDVRNFKIYPWASFQIYESHFARLRSTYLPQIIFKLATNEQRYIPDYPGPFPEVVNRLRTKIITPYVIHITDYDNEFLHLDVCNACAKRLMEVLY